MTAFDLLLVLLNLVALALALLAIVLEIAAHKARKRRGRARQEQSISSAPRSTRAFVSNSEAIAFPELATPEGLYLSTKVLDLGDKKVDGVVSVCEPNAEKDFGLRVAAEVTQHLQASAVPIDALADDHCGLGFRTADVAHEDLLTVDGQVLVTPDSVSKTVSEPTDTRPYKHVGESAGDIPMSSALAEAGDDE